MFSPQSIKTQGMSKRLKQYLAIASIVVNLFIKPGHAELNLTFVMYYFPLKKQITFSSDLN